MLTDQLKQFLIVLDSRLEFVIYFQIYRLEDQAVRYMSLNRQDKKTESINTNSKVSQSKKSSPVLPEVRGARPSPIRTKHSNSLLNAQSSELGTARSKNIGFSDRAQQYLRDKSQDHSSGPAVTSRNHQQGKSVGFHSNKKSSQGGGTGTGADKNIQGITANSSQFQSKTPQRQRANNGMLPTLVSGATRRSQAMYGMNYVLDIDSNVYSQRQNNNHIGNFYNSIVKKRILQTNQPSPLLSPEKRAIMENYRRAALSQSQKKGGSQSQAQTLDHDDFNDRMLNAESILDREMGHDIMFPQNQQNVMSQQNLMQQQKLMHVMSQDQLMIDHQKLFNVQEMSAMHRGDLSTAMRGELSTDNRQTAVDTQPQSKASPFDGDKQQFSMAESILQQSQMMDPLAGNSVVTHLNTSLRNDAKDRIDNVIDKSMYQRSRQRRRRELAGDEEIDYKPGGFAQRGDFEEHSESNIESYANQTNTSLADSSVYNILVDNLEAVNTFIESSKQEKEQMEQMEKSMGRSVAASQLKNKLSMTKMADTQKNLKTIQNEFAEMQERREDPEAHFKKLKAKIKLKCVKQYQEDLQNKKEEELEAQQPVVVIKDKFGRIIEKDKVLHVKNKKKRVSKNRKPIKRKPPGRKQSFTEMQLKYPKEDIYNPMENYPKPSLTDQYIIDMMKVADRFPIPEALVGRSKKQPFVLYVDSLISETFNLENVEKWANEKGSMDIPYNSFESEDEFKLYHSEDSEEQDVYPFIPKAKLEKDPSLKEKQFDIKLLSTSPYRNESMAYYPYRAAEGSMPVKLLKRKDLGFLFECQAKILEQQANERWSNKLLQNIFEHYCIEMKAAPFQLSQFYNYDDPNNKKISIKNFQMDEQSVKAFAMVLPYILDFTELELYNNQITDQVAACIVFSVFCNPHLKRLTVAYNYMRQSFVGVLAKLLSQKTEQITDINVMGSISFADHIDPLIRVLPSLKTLTSLNIAGCQLTQGSCRQLRDFILVCPTLRLLDVSHCRINYQSTRYIIDALNRNNCVRTFNFSHNDLTSATFEFSIKVASIITRHPSLMHIDITNTNLKREELLFIGLSLPSSKTLLSIHMTAQKLPYYERIFLRALIAARVGFQYRNSTQRRKIQSNKERNQIMQMAAGEVQSDPMKQFTSQIADLDEKREGLEFEISDLLAEMDTQASYDGVDPDTQAGDLPPDSKVSQLVGKMVERQRDLDAQQKALQDLYQKKKTQLNKNIVELDAVQDLGKELAEMFGPDQNPLQRSDSLPQDYLEKMKELKIERQRIKAEIEVQKEVKDRSAGELALMFMGINQVAYELLVENPMTGYMNEIIFSRVLGHDEIEEGTFWVDTVQCWVCQKWNKILFTYDETDHEILTQKIDKVQDLQSKIDFHVQHQLHHLRDNDIRRKNELDDEIESVIISDVQSENDKIEEVSEQFEATAHGSKFNVIGNSALEAPFGHGSSISLKQQTGLFHGQAAATNSQYQNTKNVTVSDHDNPSSALKETQGTGASGNNADVKSQDGAHATIKEEPIFAEAEDENFVIDEANIGLDQQSSQSEKLGVALVNPIDTDYDTSNILEPVKATEGMVSKIVHPEDFSGVNKIEFNMPKAEEIYGDELRKLELLEELGKHSKSIAAIRDGPHIHGMDRNNVKITPLYANPMSLGYNPSNTLQHAHHDNDHENQRQYIGSKDGNMSSFGQTGLHSSVISHTERRRRQHGDPYIIQRRIVFEGVIYQIDEELYSDSDNSSVYPSSDEFDIDNDLQRRFKLANPLVDENEKTITDNVDILDGDTIDGGATPKPSLTIQRLGTQIDDGRTSPDEAKTAEILQKTGTDFGGAGNISVGRLRGDDDSLQSEQPIIKVADKAITDEKTDQAMEELKVPEKATAKKSVKSLNPIKIAQQNAAEIFSNSPGLTYEQKIYETKIGPKHYKPQQSQRRLEHFLAKTGVRTKRQRKGEIYCCASYNDWLPMRMKTQLELKLERYPMEFPPDEIPQQVFTLNDEQAMCAAMVPPGQHFFYFVREKGTIFLSPKHDIVRFKTTNVYLNRIKVSKRLDDIETVHQAKDGEEDEAVFYKDRSVFKEYREKNHEPTLKKMFDEDIQFGKIGRTINKKEDFETEFSNIKELLFQHYPEILNIFDYYSGTSNYPTISMNDFTSFANITNILDQKIIGLAALDLLLVATCVSINAFVNSAEKDLQRYEFVEMVVRVANFRYKEQGFVQTTCEGITRTLEELIYPNAHRMDGDDFRKRYCYNVKTNDLLTKNEGVIKKVYDSFTHAKKRYIVLDEAKSFVRKIGLKISEQMVGAIYAESMMSIIDTIRDQTRPQQMKFTEFLVFLCRISHEHYKKTSYKDELMYLKLEHLLPKYLEQYGLNPVYLYGEKFKIDQAKEDRRQKRQLKKLQDQYRHSKKTGESVDPKLLAEVTAYIESKGETFRMASLEQKEISDSNDDDDDQEQDDKSKRSKDVQSRRGSDRANSAAKVSRRGGSARAQTAAIQATNLGIPDMGQTENQNLDLASDLVAQTPVQGTATPMINEIDDVRRSQQQVPNQSIMMADAAPAESVAQSQQSQVARSSVQQANSAALDPSTIAKDA